MSEPLTDYSARILCLGHEVTTTIDGLLRLQNTRDHKKPITLYVVGTTSSTPSLSLGDAVTLCSVIRSLKSPVVTMGLGFLQPTQALVLAAGTGKRWLLKHSVIHLTPMPRKGYNLGFNGTHQQKNIFETQFEALLVELKLSPSLFQTEQHLDAQQAIANNLADETINSPQPQIKATHYERR